MVYLHPTIARRSCAAAAILAIGLTASACGSSANSSDSTQTTPATSSGSAVPKSTAVITGGEVALVSAVRPKIDALVTALQGTNVDAARDAYNEYDAGWNGIEVYVNVRDKALYTHLEVDLQEPIGEGLEATSPNMAPLVAKAQELGTAYDQAIANSKAGPALSPLFDDVTALRIVRRELRLTAAELKEPDVPEAKKEFEEFTANYPLITDLVKARSDTADGAIQAAIAKLRAGFADSNTDAKTLTGLLTTLTTRYNFAVGLWNAAARNVVATKTTFSPADITAVGTLRSIEKATDASLSAWKAGDYTGATAHVTTASTAFTSIQAALKAANSDKALSDALTALAPLVAKAGNPADVTEAATKTSEAAAIAEQSLVGPFWTNPALKAALAAL